MAAAGGGLAITGVPRDPGRLGGPGKVTLGAEDVESELL